VAACSKLCTKETRCALFCMRSRGARCCCCCDAGFVFHCACIQCAAVQPAQQWSLAHKLRIAHCIAAGVAYLHSLPHPIIHRDLKPQNVLLDAAHAVAKVCDFGLAITRQASVVMTRAAGTYEYIAPEAFKANQPFTEKVCGAGQQRCCRGAF